MHVFLYNLTLLALLGGVSVTAVSQSPSAPKRVNVPKISDQQPASSRSDARTKIVKATIQKALLELSAQGYSSIPLGTRLLAVRVEKKNKKEVITVNFSKELLSQGTGAALEDAIHQIIVKIEPSPSERSKETQFKILVEGKPLERYQRQ